MKKLFALLLAAVMCFSLVACGGENEASNNEPQTDESVSQQEASQSNAPSEAPKEPEATESEQTTVVEITLDNWQEYFEIVQVVEYETNSFGETDYTAGFDVKEILMLKEQYINRLADGEQENYVIVEWNYEYGTFKYTINTDTGEYTIGEQELEFGEGISTDDDDANGNRSLSKGIEFTESYFYAYDERHDVYLATLNQFLEVIRIEGLLNLK